MTDWGVPDWLQGSAYPLTQGLTDRQWRWQFLRRRPAYRAAWEKFAPFAAGHDAVPTNDPDECREQFQLSMLLDPRRDFGDWRLFQAFVPTSGYGFTWKTIEAGDRDEEHGRVGYMFDLGKPIPPQIEAVTEYLNQLQRELKGDVKIVRPRRDNWSLFLRALDADDAGATLAAMAEAFWPGENKTPGSARDALNRAKELRANFPL